MESQTFILVGAKEWAWEIQNESMTSWAKLPEKIASIVQASGPMLRVYGAGKVWEGFGELKPVNQ